VEILLYQIVKTKRERMTGDVVNSYKENVVMLYLKNFKIYWREEDGCKMFNDYMNK
jgi:hypothetical protein